MSVDLELHSLLVKCSAISLHFHSLSSVSFFAVNLCLLHLVSSSLSNPPFLLHPDPAQSHALGKLRPARDKTTPPWSSRQLTSGWSPSRWPSTVINSSSLARPPSRSAWPSQQTTSWQWASHWLAIRTRSYPAFVSDGKN